MALPRDRMARVGEVAHYLCTTIPALHVQRYRGDDPGALGVVIGRKLLFRSEDVERWVEEKMVASKGSHPRGGGAR